MEMVKDKQLEEMNLYKKQLDQEQDQIEQQKVTSSSHARLASSHARLTAHLGRRPWEQRALLSGRWVHGF